MMGRMRVYAFSVRVFMSVCAFCYFVQRAGEGVGEFGRSCERLNEAEKG